MNSDYLHKHLQEKSVSHIIFDLDETIATLKINWAGFRNRFFREMEKIDPEIVSQTPNVSGAANILYNKIVSVHGLTAKKIADEFCEIHEVNNYSGLIANKTLLNFIKKFNNKYSLYIWTGNNRSTTSKALNDLNIRKLFTSIVTKQDVLLNKPEPDGYKKINQQNLNPNIFIMIGNNVEDRQAAKNSNIDYLDVSEIDN